ncbi:MAG: hypothetical protein AAB886_01215 [Patescibacteria group bacterium]
MKYSIAVFVGLVLLTIGAFFSSAASVSFIGLAIILITSSNRLGYAWNNLPRHLAFGAGFLGALSYLMIAGSAVYYFGVVTSTTFFFVVASLPVLARLFIADSRRPNGSSLQYEVPITKFFNSSIPQFILLVLSLAAFFLITTANSTLEPSRSPWLIVAPTALVFAALATVILFFFAKQSASRIVWVASIALVFGGITIAAFAYPNGYGFDPFLHRATVSHIAEFGTITPKPLYYIGEYSLELIALFFTGLEIPAVNIWLLPILVAIILPTVVAIFAERNFEDRKTKAVAMLGALFVPLGTFVSPTPQGLANLMFLAVIFLGFSKQGGKNAKETALLSLMAIAATLVHPLAGIPALCFLALRSIQSHFERNARRNIIIAVGAIAGSLLLPAIFVVLGGIQNIATRPLALLSLSPKTFFSTRFNAPLDLLVWLGENGWLWLLLLAIVGIVVARRRDIISRSTAVMPLVLLVSAALLALLGDFSYLISYEQGNYVSRILALALFATLPFAIIGLTEIVKRAFALPSKIVPFGIGIVIAAGVASNIFVAYPRHDAYAVSRGFTVGVSDHNTVATISSKAGDTPYIVLANQSVSAAAIEDFGFKKYFGEKSDVFYYPVPTGGPLYQIFIEMIEKSPTRERAISAMDLTGADLAYFVVNDYWWSAARAIEFAKTQTDEWFEVDNGKTSVFIFRRQSSQFHILYKSEKFQ